MRLVVWSAVALALLTVAGALRTTQVEGTSRSARRLPPSAPDTRIERTDHVPQEHTIRPRQQRRNDTHETFKTENSSPRSRLRQRSQSEAESEKTATVSTQRHDTRRFFSRTRNNPPKPTEIVKDPISVTDNVRSRLRPSNRRVSLSTVTPATVETTTAKIIESKIEVNHSNFEEASSVTPRTETITKITTRPAMNIVVTSDEDVSSAPFRRRAPVPTVSSEAVITRRQGRVYTGSNLSPLDLSVSGAMNSLSISSKEPTTARTANDIRNSKKLRYKQRLSETDSNLTGDGITLNKKVTESSQHKEIIHPSQIESQTMAPIIVDTISSNPAVPRKLTKSMKVIRRPLARGKASFKPSVSLPKKKSSDEISEDDNYPASFKALLQAKNASTHNSSPPSESLSVKESQNVYSTFTSPAQTITTGPAKNKYSTLRTSLRPEGETLTTNNGEKPADTTTMNENQAPSALATVASKFKPRSSEYRPRGTYSPRARKSSTSLSTNQESTHSSSTERSTYKFSRKYKPSTQTPSSTEKSIQTDRHLDTGKFSKKRLVRPSYLSRRKSGKTESSSERSESKNSIQEKSINVANKAVLPRTSYYSRFRKIKDSSTTSTTESIETSSETEIVQTPADKKNENSVDSPLIFSLLKAPGEESSLSGTKQTEKPFFIIAVSSMESNENSVTNEKFTKALEHTTPVDNDIGKIRFNVIQEKSSERTTPVVTEEATVIVTPSTRNIVTRKYGQKRTSNPKETQEGHLETTLKSRERHLRKYSDTDSRTSDPSQPTNNIPEQDKLKSRYSSKYRGSFSDKHSYKPTVPTITPSTAWLKFFVTDPQLAKSVEEPKWYDAEDIYVSRKVTTQMPRIFTAPPPIPITYESSLELVKGEEFKIGDMNAISFTQSRSTLPSADLTLSESLMNPMHTMNVEASQHSPSVTISIFDALADILTSTPRVPRLSTTTEITTTQQNIVETKQTDPLNGVSSNINVINVQSIESTTPVTDVDANNKYVQNNTQPNEINPDDGNVIVNTPAPTFPPTTPISARKPFAFKFLYSDSTPSDNILSTVTSSTNQPSTDSSTMVYTKVSDILLSNNNFVSSGLTSMLSNNIREIIDSMDPETRSKISEVDMSKILNSLIPKAVAGLIENRDGDDTPDTTPYSLEAIRDTENIDINNGVVSLQNVSVENLVNTTTPTDTTTLGLTLSQVEDVNSTVTMEPESTISESGMQTTLAESTTSTFSVNVSKTTILESTTTSASLTSTSSAAKDLDTTPVNNEDRVDLTKNTNLENRLIPLPFFTNAKVVNYMPSDDDELDNNVQTSRLSPVTLTTKSLTPETKITGENDLQNPSMVSPLQLWVLSKKARVLKMIEDLIRQHNTEIATTPPLTELLEQPNNIPLSNRLTEILNTMTSTESSVNIPTSPLTTLSPPPFPLITQPVESLTTTEETFSTSGVVSTTFISDISPRSGAKTTSGTENLSGTVTVPSTSILVATDLPTSQSSTVNEAITITNVEIENQGNTETTTAFVNTEPTEISIDTTTVEIDDSTNQKEHEDAVKVVPNSENVTSLNVNLSAQPSQPPKKDYVIFGILPNNTVVRKDPNEDILETLTEASPYIIYSVLPNNTVIRRFPNGTRVPRVLQKIDILPISPWSLRNPYSPIHNNPAIVRPRSNPIRVSTNIETSADSSNNGTEILTNDTVNNQQPMIPSSALNISSNSLLGVKSTTYRPPAEKSTASHVLSLRTTTMLPSVEEILLNSISSATKEEMIITSMMSSTHEPRILTLDIDPETKQIRTERPGDGDESPVFRFIPIEQVMVTPEDTNVQKLATKMPTTSDMAGTTTTETITQTPEIQTRFENTDIPTTTVQVSLENPNQNQQSFVTTNKATVKSITTTTSPSTTVEAIMTTTPVMTVTTTQAPATTQSVTTAQFSTETSATVAQASTTTQVPTTLTMPIVSTTPQSTVTSFVTATSSVEEDFKFLQNLLKPTERNPKSLSSFNSANQIPLELTTLRTETTRIASGYQSSSFSSSTQSQESNILQAVVSENNESTSKMATPNNKLSIEAQSTTSRSIEEDIKQFEEDTKLLKALLAATGQNPNALNLPSLDGLKFATSPQTTTQRSTTTRIRTTTNSDNQYVDQYIEDAKLLQALLEQATPKNTDSRNAPEISGITSNVRISSNSQTKSKQPIYTSRTVTPEATTTETPRTISTLQPFTTTTTSRLPRRQTTTPRIPMVTARRAPARFTATTEVPSTSTFSDQEDLLFLQNLKSALKTNTNNEDPEAVLANRIIALAVERSLNEIQSGKDAKDGRTGISTVPTTPIYRTTTTTQRPTTTTQRPTTTTRTTTVITNDNTPSLEDDLKQFQEDTKLLQALLKATGQDPSMINIPTLPPNLANIKVSGKLPPRTEADLNLLSNLLAAPSPLNEPFDSLTTKADRPSTTTNTTPLRYGAKIAVKDVLNTEQDDAKLLKTLVKLQGAQETTTQKGKLTITGQSTDEALKNLIAQTKPPRMMSDSTKSPVTISTEYGKSNDALLAALLKEQGFGPTTASSLDEQLRLAALLNQVVVTPKGRKTTTPPPPPAPEPQRRPILDGLAWLWQQWRETSPGPVSRPNRRPAASPGPSISSSTSNRVNWFGSGPFIGNAEESTGNRVPLEPPRAVTEPGRGQLVSAAINVTRAFSQFLGAAIQGAAQTVQSVIKAGQRATAEVYAGNGGSG